MISSVDSVFLLVAHVHHENNALLQLLLHYVHLSQYLLSRHYFTL